MTTETRSTAPTLHPFYCTTTGCRKHASNPKATPIGYAEPGRARLYCGDCRRWSSFTVETLTR